MSEIWQISNKATEAVNKAIREAYKEGFSEFEAQLKAKYDASKPKTNVKALEKDIVEVLASECEIVYGRCTACNHIIATRFAGYVEYCPFCGRKIDNAKWRRAERKDNG